MKERSVLVVPNSGYASDINLVYTTPYAYSLIDLVYNLEKTKLSVCNNMCVDYMYIRSYPVVRADVQSLGFRIS